MKAGDMSKTDKDFILRIPMNTYLSIGNPMKKAVFMAVYSFTNNGEGECYASQRAIAERAGCCQDTIKRLLPELVNDGLLKVNGDRSVRGGSIPIYALSERQSFSNSTKVNDTAPEVNDGTPTETIKETIEEQEIKNQIQPHFNELATKYKVTIKTLNNELEKYVVWQMDNKPPKNYLLRFRKWILRAIEYNPKLKIRTTEEIARDEGVELV